MISSWRPGPWRDMLITNPLPEEVSGHFIKPFTLTDARGVTLGALQDKIKPGFDEISAAPARPRLTPDVYVVVLGRLLDNFQWVKLAEEQDRA